MLMIAVAYCSPGNAQQKSQVERPVTPKQESIIVIATYSGQGDLENLHQALGSGLGNGLTINQIKEAIVHAYAYCGFPRSIRGLQTFMEVLDKRKANGIND